MKLAGRILTSLALLGLFAAPLCADVIPTRYAEKSDAHQRVESTLADAGLSAADAHVSAGRLTVEEAAHFAGQTDMHLAGDGEIWAGQANMLYWEWVIGAGYLAVGLMGLLIVSRH